MKLYFFAYEEFFRFFAGKLVYLLHMIIQWPSLTAKIRKKRKKFFRISYWYLDLNDLVFPWIWLPKSSSFLGQLLYLINNMLDLNLKMTIFFDFPKASINLNQSFFIKKAKKNDEKSKKCLKTFLSVKVVNRCHDKWSFGVEEMSKWSNKI